jgi:hypothetical protein
MVRVSSYNSHSNRIPIELNVHRLSSYMDAKWRLQEKIHALQFGVARWYIFKPKIPLWVNFGGSYNGRCCYMLSTFGLFYGQSVYFMPISIYFIVIWYIFPQFLYVVPRKIWQPCFAFAMIQCRRFIGRIPIISVAILFFKLFEGS